MANIQEYELDQKDLTRLQNANTQKRKEIWREIAERESVYPQTIYQGLSNRIFFARPLEKSTTVEDLDGGWDLSDWISGWGPGERWRIQLNRRLTPLESKRMQARIINMPESPTFEEMIDLFTNLCEADLWMIKCRKEHVEAEEIIDGWNPIWPAPVDTVVEIDHSPAGS